MTNVATVSKSSTKIAKGLQEYFNPYKQKPLVKPIHLQMLEINGKLGFGKALYHSIFYEQMMEKIAESRKEYRSSLDITRRKQIATEEISLWKDYIPKRNNHIPQEFAFTDKAKHGLKEAWDFVKNRKEDKIDPERIVDFHYEYAKAFKFGVPIDPKYIFQMVHPHSGYLSYVQTKISFQQILDLYDALILASYEKNLGQELLGSEICAYGYWNLLEDKGLGYMKINDFVNFLKVFRFSINPSRAALLKEFQFALSFSQGEFSRDIAEEEDIVRFDFFRHIFLERNL